MSENLLLEKDGTPVTLLSKQFEKMCINDGASSDNYHMSRYGVSGVFIKGKWQPIQSLPDFEGVIGDRGRQFIFDCKVCSSASFSLHDDKFKARQLKHMLARSQRGVVCFLLIHFNRRKLKTKEVPSVTYGVPVHPDLDFWEQFDRGEVRSLTKDDCLEFGHKCLWRLNPKARTPKPDLH